MMKLMVSALACLVMLVSANAVLGQDKEKIIAERQDLMKQHSRDLVAVRNWLQDKGDQAAAIAGLDAAQKSVPKVPEFFPPGTGVGQVQVKTRAKPEIWSEHDKFLAADKTVRDQLATLEAAVKSGDKQKAQTVFNEIGSCKACHDSFRAPEQR